MFSDILMGILCHGDIVLSNILMGILCHGDIVFSDICQQMYSERRTLFYWMTSYEYVVFSGVC